MTADRDLDSSAATQGRNQPSTLEGAHVLLTGGTGFVGQAVLERLLSSYATTRISLLVRPKGSVSAESRLTNLLRKPVFAAWRAEVGEQESERLVRERVTVIEGALGHGLELPGDLDVVIHSASTVSFDPPIDEAFVTNVDGATGLYEALKASGSNPHVVHVSTAYVGGTKKGVVTEGSLEHQVDWRAENTAAKTARAQTEQASRAPEVLGKLLARAKAQNGKIGPHAVATAAEAARVEWVTNRLVDHGRLRAESLGWTDVYTLTKAFAERVAEELWAAEGHTLSVVRPSIIESAVSHPFPGWIDGFKVADPIILAYGRGQLPEFPGVPDSILDVIPVDHVVNAMLAAAERPKPVGEVAYYHVTSGASNPLTLRGMYENANEFFVKHPVPSDGGHVTVPTWRFPGGREIERGLARQERKIAISNRAISRLPSTTRTRAWTERIRQRENELGTLRSFANLYRAYVQSEIIFDDTHSRALNASLSPDEQDDRGFDATTIDWHDYFQTVHIPAITGMTRVFAVRPAGKAVKRKPLPQRNDVLAVFDFEGTIVESNLVQQYLWARLGTLTPAKWPIELVGLGLSVPRFLMAERRDRGEFIRALMRRYEGMSADELDTLVKGRFGRFLRSHSLPEALRRVKEHRAAGHRTVLVTGALRSSVDTFAPFFDDVVASEMFERDGVMSGYLSAPPLVDEARGAWLVRYASDHGADLRHSYGYGDSEADVAWLQLLGHPNAVNPDSELYRHAQRRKWDVYDWRRRPTNPPTTDAPNSSPESSRQAQEGARSAAQA
jgi:phosphoserine phosphatase/nucleoside-diphosphate-sugar epimerase